MLLRVIQLLCSKRQGEMGLGLCQCKTKYLVTIKYPVHKLLGINTRFLVLSKYLSCLKYMFLKKRFPVFVLNFKSILLNNLKACVSYFLSNSYFSPNNSPSKTMQNIFYFI